MNILYRLKLIINGDAAEPWDLGFQDSGTLVHEKIINLHNNIMFYLILIIIMVLWVIIEMILTNYKIKFAHKYLTHGTNIEIIWTILPAIILLIIAWPSFELLYYMDEVIDPMITLKVIGHQWYWSYEYSDYTFNNLDNTIEFDSYMIATDDLKEGDLRLLEVDNKVLLPINTNIRVIVTAADVLHSWAIPSLGIKIDCVPGRLNQTSMIIKRPGVYYGQCSEICGVQHGFMPIVIQGCDLNEYLTFLGSKNKNLISKNLGETIIFSKEYYAEHKHEIVSKEITLDLMYDLPRSILTAYDWLVYEHKKWSDENPNIDTETKDLRFNLRKSELLEEMDKVWYEVYESYQKELWLSFWSDSVLESCKRFNLTSDVQIDCLKALDDLVIKGFENFKNSHLNHLKTVRGVDENGNIVLGQTGSTFYDEYGNVRAELLDENGKLKPNPNSNIDPTPKKPSLREFYELFDRDPNCKNTQMYMVIGELLRKEEQENNSNINN